MCSTSLQVSQVNVISHNPDSENVNRLWSDRPQPSGDANIIRCLWCFTLLMNLHDFVAELVNPVHSFHDAHTVPFCLIADHISTCLMMFSARFKPAQFWSVLIRGEWKCSICSYQRRWCGVSSRRTGVDSACGSLAASMESHGERVWKRGSFHGVPWIAIVETWQLPWSPMDSSVWIRGWWSVSTAGNGCSGMHRLSVSRQLVTDAVVCSVYRCLDSW